MHGQHLPRLLVGGTLGRPAGHGTPRAREAAKNCRSSAAGVPCFDSLGWVPEAEALCGTLLLVVIRFCEFLLALSDLLHQCATRFAILLVVC